MFHIIIAILLLTLVPITPTPLLEASQNVDLESPFLNEMDFEPFIPPFICGRETDPYGLLNVVKTFEKFYLPSGRHVSEKCSTALSKFNVGIFCNKLKSWQLRMVDSWGKVLDGFLFGNIHAVGMFEECLKIEGVATPTREDEISFSGKYCKIFHQKDPDADSSDISRSGPGLAVIKQNPLPFFYATCMPSVCTDEDLYVSLNKTFASQGRQVAKLECHTNGVSDHATEFDLFDAFVSALLILLIILAICGTIIDENNLQRFTVTDGGKRFFDGLACFSITKSFNHIFSYRKESSEAITCVHGLRVITLVWIITCHQYETAVDFLVNLINAKKYQDPIFGQFITDGYQSVDTFFCLSGILLAYRLFPSILSGKNFTGIVFIKGYLISLFRRFMRLFPNILMVAMFSATLLRFLSFGPNAPQLDAYSEQCRGTWWKDPLFVDNLVHGSDTTVLTDDCLDHCWYTAVEMQLFLIVPFVFLPRIYNKLIGFVWLFFLTLMSQVIPLIIMTIYEFPPVLFPYLTFQESYEFYTKYYKAPWCRSAPWFIGIWTGIIMVKYPHYLKRLNKMHIIIGYAIAIILGIIIVIGLYHYNHVGKHDEISNALSGVYGFFSRPIWAIAVSWVVITCYTKNAWYVNAILSWWGWQPLSRLTFSMYLVSPVVQVWWADSLFVPIYYSYTAKLFETCGVFFISFVVAVLLSTLVEGPILRLTDIASSKVLKSSASKREEDVSRA